MDISSIASTAVEMVAANTNSQLGMAVLKKVLDVEAQNAATLIDALSQAPNLPSHLGQSIDTTA